MTRLCSLYETPEVARDFYYAFNCYFSLYDFCRCIFIFDSIRDDKLKQIKMKYKYLKFVWLAESVHQKILNVA